MSPKRRRGRKTYLARASGSFGSAQSFFTSLALRAYFPELRAHLAALEGSLPRLRFGLISPRFGLIWQRSKFLYLACAPGLFPRASGSFGSARSFSPSLALRAYFPELRAHLTELAAHVAADPRHASAFLLASG